MIEKRNFRQRVTEVPFVWVRVHSRLGARSPADGGSGALRVLHHLLFGGFGHRRRRLHVARLAVPPPFRP